MSSQAPPRTATRRPNLRSTDVLLVRYKVFEARKLALHACKRELMTRHPNKTGATTLPHLVLDGTLQFVEAETPDDGGRCELLAGVGPRHELGFEARQRAAGLDG